MAKRRTSSQGWTDREDAVGAAKKLRKIGYKARASKGKVRGYYRVEYEP